MSQNSYDPGLDEVIEADEPSEAAEANGLSYRNGSVLLVLELNTEELPEGYGVEVVQEYSNGNLSLVEGYVPVENIRDLSNDTAVSYIRPPSQPVAQNDSREDPDGMNETPSNETDTTENTSDDNRSSERESADGFTVAVALLSVAVVALYARWS
jgi:hypothetical protein